MSDGVEFEQMVELELESPIIENNIKPLRKVSVLSVGKNETHKVDVIVTNSNTKGRGTYVREM